MSNHRESIAQALERAMSEADLSNAVDNAVRAVEERAPQQVRHVVRQAVAPALPALRTREGRFHPDTLVCIYCNVPKHEHGKVCGRDDYSEWQRVMREAGRRSEQLVEPAEGYVEWQQRIGWQSKGGAIKAAAAWRA